MLFRSLIILDDYSFADNHEIINRYTGNPRVSHIKLNNNTSNPFVQWQKGFIMAKGEYIWIAESDDYADPSFLGRCIAELEKHPNCVFCHTDSYLLDSEDCISNTQIDNLNYTNPSHVYYNGIDFVNHNMIESNGIYNASMVVFRKSALDFISDCYTDYDLCGDWVFWGEMALSGDVIRIPERLNYYRKHHEVTSDTVNHINLKEIVRAKIHIHNMTPLRKDVKILAVASIYKSIRKTRFFDNDFYQKYKMKFLKHYPYAPFAAMYYKSILKKRL